MIINYIITYSNNYWFMISVHVLSYCMDAYGRLLSTKEAKELQEVIVLYGCAHTVIYRPLLLNRNKIGPAVQNTKKQKQNI